MENHMADESPKIDYDSIDFPSDKLTLKQLHALAVADDPPYGDLEAFLTDQALVLVVMHHQEKLFAQFGFAKGTGDHRMIQHAMRALHEVWDNPTGSQYSEALATKDCTDKLARDYQRFGVADGLETARQMIRRLEDQAADQARARLGRTGGGGS